MWSSSRRNGIWLREYSRLAGESRSRLGLSCVNKKKLAERERDFMERGHTLSDFVTRVDSRSKRHIEDAGYRRSTPSPSPYYSREQPSSRRSHHSNCCCRDSNSQPRGSYSRPRDSYSKSKYDSDDDSGFGSGNELCHYPSTRSRSSRRQPRRICY